MGVVAEASAFVMPRVVERSRRRRKLLIVASVEEEELIVKWSDIL
jgi:hypothetical protein